MSNLLHYKIKGKGQPVLLIHGLFGNLDNLGLLARNLAKDYQVVSIDLRNHGQSTHYPSHSYDEQANDVLKLMDHLNLSNWIVIGHSMGGKVAMKLASLRSNLIKQLVVLDIAPVPYSEDRHSNVFAGILEVEHHKPTDRSQAMTLMAKHIELEGVRQFLSKSLHKVEQTLVWRFNHQALKAQYHEIIGWQTLQPNTVPTLFIKGAESDYISAEHQSAIIQQFPNAKAHVIANAGHWLHAEKPDMVLRVIRKFIDK
jgi:esterase